MKKLFLTLLLGAGGLTAAHAREYFVSSGVGPNAQAAGDDNNSGYFAYPLATIQKAADLATQPGDIVTVRSGTYTNAGAAGQVVSLKYTGTSANPIIFRRYQYDANKPLIQFNTWAAFAFSSANGALSYIQISGFKIQGNNANVTLANATNQPGSCAQNGGGGAALGIYNGSGIVAQGTSTIVHHHLTFDNNEIFECGQAGIATKLADYITVRYNTIYNCSWYTIYGSSGISLLALKSIDGNTGYHNYVVGNKCFGNDLLVPWYYGGVCQGFTDGNGIIIDKSNTTGYVGRTLVANNVVADNGGAGITAFQSSHVDILNNTAYHNSKRSGYNGGEYVVNHSKDVLVQNNIGTALSGKFASSFRYDSLRIILNNNIFAGGTVPSGGTTALDFTNNGAGVITNTGNTTAYPTFVGASNAPLTANFSLANTSQGINRGTNSVTTPSGTVTLVSVLPYDITGTTGRVYGSATELGAYENTAVARTALATTGPAEAAATALEAYPNPFAGQATLRYRTTQPGPVRLEVLDALGRRVALLLDAEQPAGAHEVPFVAPAQAAGLYRAVLTTVDGRSQQTLAPLR